MDTNSSEDVVCLNDEFDEVDGPDKVLCLFGDSTSVPIDVDADEYDVIPDRPPEEWYERYCLHDNLTPRCKALHERAIDFYNAKGLVGGDVKLEVPEIYSAQNVVPSNNVDDSGGVVRRKAEWFSRMDATISKYGAVTTPAKRGRGRPPKYGKASAILQKRGRGRLLKHTQPLVTAEKRGRGRPRKQIGMPSAPLKRGRGRPKKHGPAVISAENVQCGCNSNICDGSPQIVFVEFAASELCVECCQNIGKKFEKSVKGKLLRVELVTGDVALDSAIVKRPRGRPRKKIAFT